MILYKIIIIIIYSSFFIFNSCTINEGNLEENESLEVKKEIIKYKQLIPILESNNYNYIKQIFEMNHVNINETRNGFTILDKYEYLLNKKIIDLFKKYGAKNCEKLNNNKCFSGNVVDKIKFRIKHDKKLINYYYLKKLDKDNNINDYIRKGITHQNEYLLEFLLSNFKVNINNIMIEVIIIPNLKSKVKTKIKNEYVLDYTTKNEYILDYAISIGNKKNIKFLRKHGAKRACEILKTRCKPLSFEIEKILPDGKGIKGDK